MLDACGCEQSRPGSITVTSLPPGAPSESGDCPRPKRAAHGLQSHISALHLFQLDVGRSAAFEQEALSADLFLSSSSLAFFEVTRLDGVEVCVAARAGAGAPSGGERVRGVLASGALPENKAECLSSSRHLRS